MQRSANFHCILRYGLWAFSILCCMNGYGQTSTFIEGTESARLLSPASWLSKAENTLIHAQNRLVSSLDTSILESSLPRMIKDYELVRQDFEAHGHHMRIRNLDDMESRLIQQRQELEKWRNNMRKTGDSILHDFTALESLLSDSVHQSIREDSLLREMYGREISSIDSQLNSTVQQYRASVTRIVNVENILNHHIFSVNQVITAIEQELKERNAALYKRSHPPFWQLRADTYPEGIGQVAVKTFKRNFASLEFYIKNAYIRAILFRVLLLVITLLPIWYFRKNKDRFKKEDRNSPFKFVHKYTGASTSSFVLVMAPFIFVHAPHIFTEAILVTLAFTTSMIFVRENPEIGKRNMYVLLGLYILLKLMNLMVSVTLFGRIFWTACIFGVIPLLSVFKNVPKSEIRYKGFFRLIIGLTILLYMGGWILNFTGHYPLGRILLLAGLDQFFLAIVLFVAVYSFIDFVGILADIYNSSNRITSIRRDLIYRKLLNLVRFLAIIFWFWALILNLNAAGFMKEHISGILNQDIQIGNYTLSPGSILVFFLILYLSFYLSGLLDGLFYDEKRTEDSTGKTSLGSIILLLRLFILSLGFVVGMIIAGIPLDSVGLFFGALGVGIGLSLQGLIGNLVSGIVIAFEKPVYVGDVIEVNGQRGRVTDIGLRATKIDTGDGAEYLVPNTNLTNLAMKNWTLTNKRYKLDTLIQVDVHNNAEKVLSALSAALKKTPGILHTPVAVARLKEITPYMMNFTVSGWVSDIAKAGPTQNDLLKYIHESLDEAGISYPRKQAPDEGEQ